MANAIHIALPAACATTPRIEKMPAPTMPPMPIETAAVSPICPDPDESDGEVAVIVEIVGWVERKRNPRPTNTRLFLEFLHGIGGELHGRGRRRIDLTDERLGLGPGHRIDVEIE